MTTLSTLELVGNPDKISVISEDPHSLSLQSLTEKLVSSEIYQKTLTSLQDKFGIVVEEVHTILQQLGQEAIRLTLQQSIATPASQPTPSAATEFLVITNAPNNALNSESLQENSTINDTTPNHTAPDQVFSAAAIASTTTESILSERDQILQAIGQKFLQTRQAQGITLSQLYSKTFIPMHHLKSLEAGQLAKLPEDVFLRGFVQRIGNTLGLDGAAIAAQIPMPVEAKRVVPTWHNSLVSRPLFTPAHLYVGYAILMAGAVGGLTLMNQPREIVNEYPDFIPQEPNAHPDKDAKQDAKLSQQRQGQSSSAVSANISPPEMF